jgi:hypothetical protein
LGSKICDEAGRIKVEHATGTASNSPRPVVVRCPRRSHNRFRGGASGVSFGYTGTVASVMRPSIVLLPKKIPIQKRWQICRSWGIMLTPWGCLGQDVAASGDHRNCARDWRAAKQSRRRATSGGRVPGPERESAESRKARFSAQPKMRPNEVLPESHIFVNSLQGEALYTFGCSGCAQTTRYRMVVFRRGAGQDRRANPEGLVTQLPQPPPSDWFCLWIAIKDG